MTDQSWREHIRYRLNEGFTLGPLYVSAGGCARRVRGRWIPDGLHVWIGPYGMHAFWSKSEHERRVTFQRLRCSYPGCAVEGKHYHRDTPDGEEVARAA